MQELIWTFIKAVLVIGASLYTYNLGEYNMLIVWLWLIIFLYSFEDLVKTIKRIF